jgi:hypothetical protein
MVVTVLIVSGALCLEGIAGGRTRHSLGGGHQTGIIRIDDVVGIQI